MTLHIRLLGGCSVIHNDEQVQATQRARLQSFLAYLLLHSTAPLPRQHVAFLFWPDSVEEQARRNLRKILHDLRRALPDADQFLHVDSHTLQWRADASFTFDVSSFEELMHSANGIGATERAGERDLLDEAVSLYQGDLLPSCYDDWILPDRERLRQAYCRMLERLMQLAEDELDYPAAIAYANRLLHSDPLRESTYRRLMRLHALRGDRAEALRVYHACVARLQEEMGVEPGPELQAAYARLLNMEIPDQRFQVDKRQASRTRMVGRGEEWRVLQEAWGQASKHGIHLCQIWGEAGIGKTRLAQELRTWATVQGFSVAYTRVYEMAGSLAFTPVIDWLRTPPLQAALSTLDAVWLSEIARLLPDLLVERPDLPPPEPLQGRWQRQRLFQALVQAFVATQQPLLLVLDDVQWCDPDTLEWLHYLLNHIQDTEQEARDGLQSTAILIVFTARKEEIDQSHPITSLLSAVDYAERLVEISLSPLSQDQATQLAAQIQSIEPDTESAMNLFTYTDGNPFYLVETLRSERWQSIVQRATQTAIDHMDDAQSHSLPPKVYTLIRLRLAQLSADARQLAGLCAVIGRAFSFDLLRHASHLGEMDLMHGLDELWRRGILSDQADGLYDFSHDRIREVTYAEISPVQRSLLHGHTAHALAKLYEEDSDSISAQLGLHHELAGDTLAALGYYLRAAEVSLTLATPEQALAYADKALALLATQPQTRTTQEQLFDSMLTKERALIGTQGLTSAARKDVLDRAYTVAEKLDDPERQFEALLGLRLYLGPRGEWHQAYAVVCKLAVLAERLQNPRFIDLADSVMSSTLFVKGEFQAAHRLMERLLMRRNRNEHGREKLNQPSHRAALSWLIGYPERARAEAFESIRIADQLGYPDIRLMTREFALYLLQYIDDRTALRRGVQELIELCAIYGYPTNAGSAQFMDGWLMAQDGAWRAGMARMQEEFDRSRLSHNHAHVPYYLVLFAQVQAQIGQMAAAMDTLQSAREMSEESGERMWLAEILRLTGVQQERLNYADSDVEEMYRSALTVARQQDAKSLQLRAVMSLARLWQRQGNRAQAHSLLAETYNWFTEGFETRDLRNAKALLGELASQM